MSRFSSLFVTNSLAREAFALPPLAAAAEEVSALLLSNEQKIKLKINLDVSSFHFHNLIMTQRVAR
jgi:hypothetical protein